jgi:dUTP pyrophosphatase
MKLQVKRFAFAAEELPGYATEEAAGLDLRAAAEMEIPPHGRRLIPTGIAVAIPAGCEGQVRSRSGLAAKHGLRVFQGVGTIDSDYRGEISVLMENVGHMPYRVIDGDRIAQLVISPVSHVEVEEVEELLETLRGSGGWGSTGQA